MTQTEAIASISAVLRRGRERETLALMVLVAALALAVVLSITQGAMPIPLKRMLAIVASTFGMASADPHDAAQEAVFLLVRLPRVCLGALVGASLAVSGAALQGLFRNPLADPTLIGVSFGAALAAAAAIVLGGTLGAILPAALLGYLLPLAAFCGGIVATTVVYRIASRDGRTDTTTMLLGGVAVNAMCGAGIGLLIFVSTDQQLRDLNFWTLGSLGAATWDRIAVAGPLIMTGALLIQPFARHLNAMLLGDNEALHLGFEIQRAKLGIVVLVALAVGASVALTGVISFVGLVVPHLIRLLLGADHRILLPASALLGATLMLGADLLARTIVLPAELPLGILTGCVGGPFFLWLLMRRRAAEGA